MKQKKEYDDSWRWTADLIVKYAPENYDERGIYRKEEPGNEKPLFIGIAQYAFLYDLCCKLKQDNGQ